MEDQARREEILERLQVLLPSVDGKPTTYHTTDPETMRLLRELDAIDGQEDTWLTGRHG